LEDNHLLPAKIRLTTPLTAVTLSLLAFCGCKTNTQQADLLAAASDAARDNVVYQLSEREGEVLAYRCAAESMTATGCPTDTIYSQIERADFVASLVLESSRLETTLLAQRQYWEKLPHNTQLNTRELSLLEKRRRDHRLFGQWLKRIQKGQEKLELIADDVQIQAATKSNAIILDFALAVVWQQQILSDEEQGLHWFFVGNHEPFVGAEKRCREVVSGSRLPTYSEGNRFMHQQSHLDFHIFTRHYDDVNRGFWVSDVPQHLLESYDNEFDDTGRRAWIMTIDQQHLAGELLFNDLRSSLLCVRRQL